MRAALPILLGVHLLLFGVFYAGPGVLLSRDLPFHHYPLKSLAAEQWRAGQVPFWDDQGNCGQPLLANPSASALYPPLWALAVLPGLKTFTLVLALHHLWMLFGAFLLARSLLGDPWRALVPAFVFGLSGPILGSLPFANPFLGMAWLPWALWGYRCFIRSGRGAGLALAAGAFAMAILAGFDFAPLLFPASLAVLALAQGDGRRGLGAASAAAALGLLIAAAQILPTAAYLPHARRADPLAYADRSGFFSFHPLRTAEWVVPGLLGWQDPESGAVAGGKLADRGTGLFQMPYLGLGALLLLLARGGGRRAERWWWTAGAAAAALAFGRFLPIHRWVHSLPGLGAFRFPEKYLLFLPVVLFFLVAAALHGDRTPRRLAPWVPAALLGALFAAALLTGGGPLSGWLMAATLGPLPGAGHAAVLRVGTALAAALLGAAVLTLVRSPRIRSILFAAVVAGDLLLAPHPGLEAADPGWAALSPLAAELKNQGCARLVVWDAGTAGAGAASVESVPGAVVQERFRTLTPLSGVSSGLRYAFTDLIDEMDPRVLPRALAPGDLQAFGVSHAIVSGEVGALDDAERTAFPGGALFRLAGPVTDSWFYSDGAEGARPVGPMERMGPAGNLRLTVRADGPGVLRVGETGLPGWRAWVDGEPCPLLHDGFAGLALRLPAGESVIRLSYRAPGWRAGLGLTVTGLLLCLIMCAWKRKPASA